MGKDTFTPIQIAQEEYNSNLNEGAISGNNPSNYQIEDYLLEQEYEYESDEQKAFQERLANGEIRIARSAEDAKNGNWVDINSELWGDKEGLRYETREDGAILIYEGDTPLGWTYPTEENNIFGIKTDGMVITQGGEKYYKQEDGSWVSITGKFHKVGEETIAETASSADDTQPISTTDTIEYYYDGVDENGNSIYNGSDGKTYRYDNNIGDYVPYTTDTIEYYYDGVDENGNSIYNGSDGKTYRYDNNTGKYTPYSQSTTLRDYQDGSNRVGDAGSDGQTSNVSSDISEAREIDKYEAESMRFYIGDGTRDVAGDNVNVSIEDILEGNAHQRSAFLKEGVTYDNAEIVYNDNGRPEIIATATSSGSGTSETVRFTEGILNYIFGEEEYEEFAEKNSN